VIRHHEFREAGCEDLKGMIHTYTGGRWPWIALLPRTQSGNDRADDVPHELR
jgi:hypothetical protein